MTRACFLVVLAGCVASGASARTPAPDNAWAPAGPRFSTVLALDRDPAAPATMLAGVYFGGLYKSTDYGFSWQYVETAFSSRSIFSISYAASSPGTVYVGTFHDGAYRSDDGGETWTQVIAGLTDLDVQVIASDPSDGTAVVAATGNGGIFRSGDRGEHWTRVDAETPSLRGKAIAFDPLQPGVAYLGTIGRGAFRSTDGGVTWTSFGAGLDSSTVLSLRFGAPPSRDLYAGTDNGAFALRRGAEAWLDITGNLPPYPIDDLLPHPSIEHFAFAATSAGTFATGSDLAPDWSMWMSVPARVLAVDPSGSVFHEASVHGGLQASTNFGYSWYPANHGMQNVFIGALAVVNGGPEGTVVYAGSDFAVHRGALDRWETFFDEHQGVFDIQADPSNGDIVYIGTERSGVWKTVNGARDWTRASTNIVPAHVYSLGQSSDGVTLYAGTSSGLYVSADKGHEWTPGNASSLGIVLSVAPDPARYPLLFVGGADGKVFWSDDAAKSYHDASNGLPRENIVSLVTAPWEKTYAITASGGLFATSDNGRNWFAAKIGVAEPALSIAADPGRAWVLYLGTSGGGLYKSESGSLGWTPRNDGLTSPFVFSVAVDPAAAETVYAGTLDGVFRSSDGAQSWTRRSEGLPGGAVTTLLVDRNDSTVLYASVQEAGVFRSTDAGATWTATGAGVPTSGAVPILQNSIDGSQLLAGTARGGVYASGDRGATWSQSSFGMSLFVRGLAIDPSAPQTLYAGSLGAGVFRSTDGGTNWTSAGLTDRNIFKLALDPRHTSTVYAATSRGVSRSTDGGATWHGVGQQAAYVYAMAVDSRDRRRVFIGTTAGSVYRTADGGDTWDLVNSGLPPDSVSALALDAAGGTLYAGLERQGVWRSTDDGTRWSRMPGGPLDSAFVTGIAVDNAHHVYASTQGSGVFVERGNGWELAGGGLASSHVAAIAIAGDGTIVAGTSDAGIFRSVDGARSWAWAGQGLTTSRITSLAADAANALVLFASTPDGVFRTTDSGATWRALNVGMRHVNTWSVDVTASGELLAATNGAGVFRSSDGGATWSPSSAGLMNLDVRAIARGAGAATIYAATLGGGVARSFDGGRTWTGGVAPALVDSVALALAVDPTDSTVYAATGGSGVLRSRNGGGDWQSVNNGLEGLFVLALALDRQHPRTLYAGTSDRGVFYTTDAGDSWHALNTGLFNHVVTSIAMDPADSTRVFAGTEGGGVFAAHVSLPASTCTYAVTPATIRAGSTAASYAVTVTAGANCPWQVDIASEWISGPHGDARVGNGTLDLAVAINVGQDARSGLVFVAGRPVAIVQDGLAVLYRLTVSRLGTGSGFASSDWLGIACGTDCDQLYTDHLPVVLTAIADRGSRFAGWEGDADCTDGQLVMLADRTCVARFEQSGDFDDDGLPNLWEVQFGLDPAVADGADGPDGDPDDDGRTNRQEFEDGTHPRGTDVIYVADGVVAENQDTSIALFNPTAAAARVLVRFVRGGVTIAAEYRYLPALSRAQIAASAVAGVTDGPVSAVIEADRSIVAERTVSRASPHATDAEAALHASAQWFLPSLSTSGGFVQRVVLFNPEDAAASVVMTYLPVGGTPVSSTHQIGPRGRMDIDIASEHALLAGVDALAAAIESDALIVAVAVLETADHRASVAINGAAAPAYLWYFANGETGSTLASRIDVLNPTATSADVTLTYLLASGGIVQTTRVCPAFGSIRVDPATDDPLLRSAVFGAVLSAPSPVVASSATWWPGSRAIDWYEGGATLGSTATALTWALADGEVGGPLNRETEITIANASGAAASALVTLVFDDGTTTAQTFDVAPIGQSVIPIASQFPQAAWRRFSTRVESSAPVVVEQVIYSSPDGTARSGGARVMGTVIPE